MGCILIFVIGILIILGMITILFSRKLASLVTDPRMILGMVLCFGLFTTCFMYGCEKLLVFAGCCHEKTIVGKDKETP